MNSQAVKTIFAVSLFVLLVYIPGLFILGTITPALTMTFGLSKEHMIPIMLVYWLFYRLILFLFTGIAVGSKVASSKIGYAVAAGVLVTIGLFVLEAVATGALEGGYPSRLPLGKTIGYVGVLTAQIACSAVGGWIASRRVFR